MNFCDETCPVSYDVFVLLQLIMLIFTGPLFSIPMKIVQLLRMYMYYYDNACKSKVPWDWYELLRQSLFSSMGIVCTKLC